MANAVNGNTIFVDTADTLLNKKGVRVAYVIVTATSANAVLVLQDNTQSINKIDLRVATSGESKVFDFSETPLYFPGGVKASTVTNTNSTLVIKEVGA